jgi:hypothetical protein
MTAHRASSALPAIYGFGYYPRMGGLISYGVGGIDLWRRAAPYVDRILRGRQSRGLAGPAAHQIRVGDQPQDG